MGVSAMSNEVNQGAGIANIHRLSRGERTTQLIIQTLCERECIEPLRALTVIVVEPNNHKAGRLLGCSAFAISLMRNRLPELLRLLLPIGHYRYLMGEETKEVCEPLRLQLEKPKAVSAVQKSDRMAEKTANY